MHYLQYKQVRRYGRFAQMEYLAVAAYSLNLAPFGFPTAPPKGC